LYPTQRKYSLTDFADLEISLNKADGGKYGVEMCFSQPNSEADTRIGADAPITVEFDLPTLQALIVDPLEHGKMLTESLFADEKLRAGFAQSQASANSAQASLRVRLQIGPSAPELNTIYWKPCSIRGIKNRNC
jgi:hypothetical protein